jgi:hypothetical protein
MTQEPVSPQAKTRAMSAYHVVADTLWTLRAAASAISRATITAPDKPVDQHLGDVHPIHEEGSNLKERIGTADGSELREHAGSNREDQKWHQHLSPTEPEPI